MSRVLTIVLLLAMTSGCSLMMLPLIKDCPKPPQILMEPPKDLETIPEDDLTFTTMANTTGRNFKTYHETADRLRALQAWAKEVTK